MMKKVNKSLFTLLVVAFMAFVLAFATVGMTKTNAKADDLARPEAYTEAAASDFYVHSGARVRVTETQSGIAFGSYVTKAYHEQLVKTYGTVEYFATAQKVGGTSWSALRFPIQPSFADGAADTDVFELRTYINFNSLEDNDEAYRKAAYATDFTIETYVNAGGTYFKAADAENGIARSMQAVGNAASLDFVDTDSDGAHDKYGYTQADLEKYFTVGERKTESAYVFADDDQDFVTLSGIDGTANPNVEMFLGAKSLGKFTYNADLKAYVGNVTAAGNVSAFVDGKVYSTTALEATKLTEETITDIQSATTGCYVLAEDVNMANVAWTAYASKVYFKGIFDGMNHTIDGLTNKAGQTGGFFYYVQSAVIKNVAFTNATITGNTGGVIGRDFRKGSVLENVYVHIISGGTNSGTFAAFEDSVGTNGTSTFKDVTIAVDAGTSSFVNSTFATDIVLDNCYFVGPAGKAITVPGTLKGAILGTDGEAAVEGVDYFVSSDEVDFVMNTQEGKTTMTSFVADTLVANQKDCLDSVVYINSTNVTELVDATTGYYVIEKDIDMTGVTFTHTTNTVFSGVLNGRGHTISNFTTGGAQWGCLLPKVSGTVKNIAFTDAVVSNSTSGVLARGLQGSAVIENVYIHVSAIKAAAGAIAGVTEASSTITLKDLTVVIGSGGSSFINGGAYGNGNIVVENCYFVAPTELSVLHLNSASSGVVTTTEDTDYFRYIDKGELIGEVLANKTNMTDFVEKSFLDNQVRYINSSNITDLQSATNKYYYLTEDIDMSIIDLNGEEDGLGTWAPTSTFTGTLDGNGHTISNFSGASLFQLFNGTVKNITFINASYTGNGFLSSGNVAVNVTIENSSFDLNLSTGSRSSLIGYQTGATATLTNVNVNMPITTSGYVGFITSHAINGLVLDNVNMIGGNGEVHSTGGNHSTLIVKDGTITGTYTIYTAETLAEAVVSGSASESLADFATECGLVTPISAENVALLQTATDGYYYLTEDIDMSTIDLNGEEDGLGNWYPTAEFIGIFNGNGHTVSNFVHSAHGDTMGFFGDVKGATIKNFKLVGSATGNNKNLLIGYIRGTGTVIENVYIEATKFTAFNGGIVSHGVVDDCTMTNVIVNVKVSSVNATNGLLHGNHAGGKLTVNNVFVVDEATEETKLTSLYHTSLVVTGEVTVVNSIDELDRDVIKDTGLATFFDESFFG